MSSISGIDKKLDICYFLVNNSYLKLYPEVGMLIKCLMGLVTGNAFIMFLAVLFFYKFSEPKKSAVILLLVNLSPVAILSLTPAVWPPMFSLLIFALCIIFSLASFKIGMTNMQKNEGMSLVIFIISPLLNSIGGLIWIGKAGVLSSAACVCLAVTAVCAIAATVWVLINIDE